MTGSPATGPATEGAGSVTARWVAVQQLLARYLDAVDGADLDAVADLLAGATVRTPAGELRGGSAIREAYARIQPAPLPDGRRRTKHHLTNLVVSEPDEDGVVVAEASYLVLVPGDDGPRVQKSGRFRDLVRWDGTSWTIREHVVIPDL